MLVRKLEDFKYEIIFPWRNPFPYSTSILEHHLEQSAFDFLVEHGRPYLLRDVSERDRNRYNFPLGILESASSDGTMFKGVFRFNPYFEEAQYVVKCLDEGIRLSFSLGFKKINPDKLIVYCVEIDEYVLTWVTIPTRGKYGKDDLVHSESRHSYEKVHSLP